MREVGGEGGGALCEGWQNRATRMQSAIYFSYLERTFRPPPARTQPRLGDELRDVAREPAVAPVVHPLAVHVAARRRREGGRQGRGQEGKEGGVGVGVAGPTTTHSARGPRPRVADLGIWPKEKHRASRRIDAPVHQLRPAGRALRPALGRHLHRGLRRHAARAIRGGPENDKRARTASYRVWFDVDSGRWQGPAGMKAEVFSRQPRSYGPPLARDNRHQRGYRAMVCSP